MPHEKPQCGTDHSETVEAKVPKSILFEGTPGEIRCSLKVFVSIDGIAVCCAYLIARHLPERMDM